MKSNCLFPFITYSGVDFMYLVDYDFITIKNQRNKDAEGHFRNSIK